MTSAVKPSAATRLQPVIDQIAAGAVERELGRLLPFEPVDELRNAGFGSLRVPEEYGGAGIRLHELFDILIELGAADPNVLQSLRGHVGFTEMILDLPASPRREFWLQEIGRGSLIANAFSERN